VSHARLVVTGGGGDPVQLLRNVAKAAKPTAGDLLHAGNLLKTRIIDRTARGIDVNGQSFHPYSTKGPYYFYPFGKTGSKNFTVKQKVSAATRLRAKIGGTKTRSGMGLKFASYAAFKSALGRSTVDLTGLRAPHMLQAIEVKVNDQTSTIILGIYGEEAERASGHNTGVPGRLPRRYFFGASPLDLKVLLADLQGRALLRMQNVIENVA
jgi:hypothetical protein